MKKKYVSFSILETRNAYCGKDFNAEEMSVLEMFFSIDYVLYKFSCLIKWAQDPSFHCRHANITFLRKENNKMIIGDLYDKDSSVRKFILPIEDFVKLLKDWEKVARKKPKEIIITKEGDSITVMGKD